MTANPNPEHGIRLTCGCEQCTLIRKDIALANRCREQHLDYAPVIEAAKACIEAWERYGLFRSDSDPVHLPDSFLGRAEIATFALRAALVATTKATSDV